MIDFREYSIYPICDTDIWVFICLGNIVKELFEKHKKIIVADVVEGEILRWNNGDSKFKYIAERFIENRECGNILVIRHSEDIPDEDRGILEQQLFELGFENDFLNKPPEQHKGEFVSAIYADYFEIPLMKSNDSDFGDGGRGRVAFPDLKVKNWYDTTEELIRDNRKRMNVRRSVEEKSKHMKREKESFNEKRNNESLEDKLAKLMSKYKN